jgi:Phage terminase large subunit
VVSVAEDIRRALDPVQLARAAGIAPDPWQVDVLRSTAPRILLNCSRQSGKSTAVACLAVHTALYEPGSLTLLVSRAERQSGELFKKCMAIYRALGRPVPAEAESALQIELESGSRIVALPGKEETIRSYSGVKLLIIDESARVPDTTYYSVRPMLAVSSGRLICLSTPFGDRGWWASAWNGTEPWERYEIAATMCPRISPAFLEEERRTLGRWFYSQEYECTFEAAQSAAFTRAEVDRAFGQEVEQWAL